MEAHLRAGIAIYNAGDYHEAHDAWEDRWLELDRGTDDERFLHGLIQFTAAVHHADRGNPAGATGLAESAREYLAALPPEYRGVGVGTAREFLARLERRPSLVERVDPPALTHGGEEITLGDLSVPALAVAAEVYAEEGGYDRGIVGQAAEYARADLEAGEPTSEFVALVADFVREREGRGLVYRRLADHVRRRRSRDEDVDGLFE